MKNKKIKFTGLIMSMLLLIAACVDNQSFDIPVANVTENPDMSGLQKITFRAVKAAYEQALLNGDDVVVFEEDLYIEGYVVSSDKAGNFFEELIVQNTSGEEASSDDERLGFRVSINQSGLYQTYEFGRKVFIKLKNLSVGKLNGVLTIGKGTSVGQIQAYEYKSIVLRGVEVATIIPKTIAISTIQDSDYNTFIKLDETQFYRGDLGLTFAGEATDEYSGLRTVESCVGNTSIMLETSTFADFKSLTVNRNKGNISGVLSRDFTDGFDVLLINSPTNIDFTDENRCDPVELNCGLLVSEASTVLFYEDFEEHPVSIPVALEGWLNYNEEGSVLWETYTQTGTNASQGVSARIGSYRSQDVSSVTWLISPEINLNSYDLITLSFETSNSYADGSNLEVLYSVDWDGTETGVSNATWGVLSNAYVVNDGDLFSSWYSSGIVDLSCETSSIYIAFKYIGSGDENFDGTFELDNIKVTVD